MTPPLLCEACERKYVVGPACPKCGVTEVCARCGWCDECARRTVPGHDLMLHAHSHDYPDSTEPHEHLHGGPGHMGLEHIHPHRHAPREQQ